MKTSEEKRQEEKQREETMKSIYGEEALLEDGLTSSPPGEE